jgi:SAM-dependent methyltransferase
MSSPAPSTHFSKSAIKWIVPPFVRPAVRRAYQHVASLLRGPYQRYVQTPVRLRQRASNIERKLEIGPGPQRIDGFETLNVVAGQNVDYVLNAANALPFASATFALIYASHVLEHIPWYRTDEVLNEWVRILKPGGRLEIWVPDGLKICQAFVDAEQRGSTDFMLDDWYRLNEQRDPCRWASGRIFSYGDGQGTRDHENWHLAVFSYRYLEQALRRAGCESIERLDRSHVRGHDHGWINLGIAGTKR